MQNATTSSRPPQSYASNWGNDLKVEIPETGVSIGELHRFLRDWLGHDTHISGEVWHTASRHRRHRPRRRQERRSLHRHGSRSRRADAEGGGACLWQHPALSLRQLSGSQSEPPGAVLRIAEADAIYRKLI